MALVGSPGGTEGGSRRRGGRSSRRRRARRRHASTRRRRPRRARSQERGASSGRGRASRERLRRGGRAPGSLPRPSCAKRARSLPRVSRRGARDGSKLVRDELELSARCCARCCARAWRRCPPRPCCASTRATSGWPRICSPSSASSWRSSGRCETAGGVELTRGDGRAVRNTVEERLANAEPALRLLFGGAQPARGAMIQLTSAADFAYGNTRLRARKGELLGAAEYEALLGRDVDGDPRGPRRHGLPRRDRSRARRHAAASARCTSRSAGTWRAALGELRAFYEGRSRRARRPASLPLRSAQPARAPARAGARPSRRSRCSRTSFRSARSAGRRRRRSRASRSSRGPSTCSSPGGCRIPAGARALADAWPEYERTEDLAALEHALTARHAQRLDEALRAAGPGADSLRELVAREHDAVNVLVVLRLRFALQLDELTDLPPRSERRPLPGRRKNRRGRARGRAAAADACRSRREARRRRTTRGLACAAAAHRVRRRPADVAARARGESCPLGRRVCSSAATRSASTSRSRSRSRQENEVRNLRLLGEGAAGGLPAAALRAQLIVPWGGRWDA